jgi:hypothetical protein
MKPHSELLLVPLLTVFFLSGCATHEPLPRLEYRAAAPMGPATAAEKIAPVQATMTLEAGEAIGHSLTSYALMPGGYAMPIKSGPSPTTDFNAEDQAAFMENLARVLAERGVIKLVTPDDHPATTITLKFLKTEHFPDMQDYVVDALLTARAGDKAYDKIYHVSTIDSVNLVARMFQHPVDGRRRAAELLLNSMVPDLEHWLAASPLTTGKEPEALVVRRPFEQCAPEILKFLRTHYVRPSTFWKGGIDVSAVRPGPNVAVIELRWSDVDAVPPFCVVDLYAAGEVTRITIRERNPFLSSRVHVTEALEEYVKSAAVTPEQSTPK